MDTENVSAFAAYQTEMFEEPTPVVPERNFQDLSRNEMIAHLISKKKQELKRKKSVSETRDENPNSKKATKQSKKAAANSAPVSQSNLLSSKEAVNGNGISEQKPKTVKVCFIHNLFVSV